MVLEYIINNDHFLPTQNQHMVLAENYKLQLGSTFAQYSSLIKCNFAFFIVPSPSRMLVCTTCSAHLNADILSHTQSANFAIIITVCKSGTHNYFERTQTDTKIMEKFKHCKLVLAAVVVAAAVAAPHTMAFNSLYTYCEVYLVMCVVSVFSLHTKTINVRAIT